MEEELGVAPSVALVLILLAAVLGLGFGVFAIFKEAVETTETNLGDTVEGRYHQQQVAKETEEKTKPLTTPKPKVKAPTYKIVWGSLLVLSVVLYNIYLGRRLYNENRKLQGYSTLFSWTGGRRIHEG